MNKNWLIVTSYELQGLASKVRYDLTRTVPCVGQKASALGRLYEKELNHGLTYHEAARKHIGTSVPAFSVVAISWSQVRDNNTHESWENAPLFVPTVG